MEGYVLLKQNKNKNRKRWKRRKYLQISEQAEKGGSEENSLGKKRRGRDVISFPKVFCRLPIPIILYPTTLPQSVIK